MFLNTYPLKSDFSIGWHYPPSETVSRSSTATPPPPSPKEILQGHLIGLWPGCEGHLLAGKEIATLPVPAFTALMFQHH